MQSLSYFTVIPLVAPSYMGILFYCSFNNYPPLYENGGLWCVVSHSCPLYMQSVSYFTVIPIFPPLYGDGRPRCLVLCNFPLCMLSSYYFTVIQIVARFPYIGIRGKRGGLMLCLVKFSPLYAKLISFYCYFNSYTLPLYGNKRGALMLYLVKFPHLYP